MRSSNRYTIRAAHVADKLPLKDLREKFGVAAVTDFSNYEMVIHYGINSYAFIYNYGSIVFFNVPEQFQERELLTLRATKQGAKIGGTSEAYSVEEQLEGEVANQVFYDKVVTGKLSYSKTRIISMLVAESVALEYYENLIESLLDRTTQYTKALEKTGRFKESQSSVVRFIGKALSTKHEIISNLYIVDSPEETWDSAEVDKLHADLKFMFEIDVRFRALEYKSKMIQESLEVISDLIKVRVSNMLELVIILLIGFEILMGFFGRH